MHFYIFARLAINQPLFKKCLKSFTALVSFQSETRQEQTLSINSWLAVQQHWVYECTLPVSQCLQLTYSPAQNVNHCRLLYFPQVRHTYFVYNVIFSAIVQILKLINFDSRLISLNENLQFRHWVRWWFSNYSDWFREFIQWVYSNDSLKEPAHKSHFAWSAASLFIGATHEDNSIEKNAISYYFALQYTPFISSHLIQIGNPQKILCHHKTRFERYRKQWTAPQNLTLLWTGGDILLVKYNVRNRILTPTIFAV